MIRGRHHPRRGQGHEHPLVGFEVDRRRRWIGGRREPDGLEAARVGAAIGDALELERGQAEVIAHPARDGDAVADRHRGRTGCRPHEDAVARGRVAVTTRLLHEESAPSGLEVGGHDSGRGNARADHGRRRAGALDGADAGALGEHGQRREGDQSDRRQDGSGGPEHNGQVYTQAWKPFSSSMATSCSLAA